ncbi:hypothetical protein [Flagellimonas zhangzhouensis]|uniref:Uncharacterized protein n=1 Tax=Flagellimonas zhangzhouensis TaxID=1073328 RepID=A0A1H2T124_9FLAO|nr:hypothetical protein [Allomuricauda zhangzhouensis]SDQ82311.1 hypothetical protein SAMN05216294_2735 [Allomuricauda zhangzhouensis]SDW37551.1 hypothetical protein SAMN04487892_1374 [Allomuricauda zhangzhouensis]
MFKIFKIPPVKPSLCQLDNLYAQSICELSVPQQIAYCKRLIESSQFYLTHSCSKKEIPYLKELIDAADRELQLLYDR